MNTLSKIQLREKYEEADAVKIATLIVDTKIDGNRGYWALASQALIAHGLLFCHYTQSKGKAFDPGNLLSLLRNDPAEIIHAMIHTKYQDGRNGTLHARILRYAEELKSMPQAQLHGVIATAISYLRKFQKIGTPPVGGAVETDHIKD